MLEETKDAILVIDTDQNILLANIEATKMYHNITNSEENLLGKKLSALVLSPEKLVVHSKQSNSIVKMARIISSQSPRLMSVKTIGHVIFLKMRQKRLLSQNSLSAQQHMLRHYKVNHTNL